MDNEFCYFRTESLIKSWNVHAAPQMLYLLTAGMWGIGNKQKNFLLQMLPVNFYSMFI